MCSTKRVGTGEARLICPSGVMIFGEGTRIGMMARKTGVMDHCTEESIW